MTVSPTDSRPDREGALSLDPAAALVTACCRAHPEDQHLAEIRRRASVSGLDPLLVLEVATRHGVAALVERSLRLAGVVELPEAVTSALRQSAHSAAWQSTLLAEELVRIRGMFDAAGIESLPFKGPSLAVALYGRIELRAFGDIDLLVSSSDADRAERIAREDGYETQAQDASCCVLSHPERRVKLELHQRLMRRGWPCAAPVRLEEVRLGDEVEVLGTPLPSMAADDLLLYLCSHGSLHAWSRLSWLCDVAELLRGHDAVDLPALRARADAVGARRQLDLGLVLASQLLDAPVGSEVVAAAQADSVTTRIADLLTRWFFEPGGADDSQEQWFLRYEIVERKRDLAAFARWFVGENSASLLTPSDRDRELLPSRGPLSYLGVAVKPFRLLRDLLRQRRNARG